MSAQQTLRDGKLDEALAELQQEVRRDPSDAKLRVFLFQLLAVQGQWDRALTQLDVTGELDASTLVMVQAYREAIRCEMLRGEVFAGKRTPLIFGEPPSWVALLMESLRLSAQELYAQAGSLREQAFEQASATPGVIRCGVRGTDQLADETAQEEPFAWIADADTRLGPVLEAIVNGRYYWIPFERIRQIDFDPPEDLRDVVWMPAHFVWTNGGEAVGLIPTRYPGSAEHASPEVRLARQTVWTEREGGACFGFGQRVLATEGGEYALLSLRQIAWPVTEETSHDA
ncbi:MAG: type VI secretion system accessory protein TagJ [Planctomycetota bacterium]|nr:type VI secretion system accessory protein TagJ [Planctomycetota bacterium]